jgi:ADP-ribose pyrophosphatase YjhB (NUDIX family)
LQRELKEELGFDYIPDFVESICIVDRSKEPKPRHIAIATVCVVDFESAEFSGDEKEFRDRSLVVLPERELRFSKLSPERWSQAIIERLLKWVFL